MTKEVQQKDKLTLRQAPQIPGITYRKFRGESDSEAMAAIINAANQADGEDHLATVEEIRNNYAHLERSDPNTDMIFVEFEGQAVGFGRCMWDTELSGDYIYSFGLVLHPNCRQDSIPSAMTEFLQERLIEIAAQHPADAPKYFQSWGLDSAVWHKQLMGQLGLTPVRYEISMTRPCSLPVEVHPLPQGFEIRPAEPEHYRKIFDADNDAFRDHWDYVPNTENDYQRWLNQPIFDPSIWKVAWEGDQVVGMVRNFIDHKENQAFNRNRGYTEHISVRPPWRRRGIARALLTQSIYMFQEMGMDETALGVDTDSPTGANTLYEDVGYTETQRSVFYRAQINL
jgi:ribosomal protein S18 acetylase RimI-like enzyme